MSKSIHKREPDRIRLTTTATHDLLRAIVARICTADPTAPLLLESLVSWRQPSRFSALSVEDREDSSGRGLCNTNRPTVHDEVDRCFLGHAVRGRGRRHRRDLSIAGTTAIGSINIRRCNSARIASEDFS